MNRYVTIKRLLSFSILLSSYTIFGSMAVSIFDVGQGNCVLVGCSKQPIMLIDCGSTTHKKPTTVAAEKRFKAIILKIVELSTTYKINEVQILLSHPDIDHCNWVPTLYDLIKQEKSVKLFISKLYLGGVRRYYPSSVQTLVSSYEAEHGMEHVNFVTMQLGGSYTIDSKSLPSYCTILPALFKEEKADQNDNSLVVLLQFGKIRCIIPGDATKKTTDNILRLCKKEMLAADMLLASHHGADDDGCNGKEWLDAINPRYIVFSSGMNKGYLHPRATLVERFETHPSIRELKEWHPLCTGIGGELLPNKELPQQLYALNKKKYGLLAASKALYCTLNQGDITFNWKQDDVELTPPTCSKTESSTDAKLLILHSLSKQTNVDFTPEFLVLLKLSNLKINGKDDSERELVNKTLASLQVSPAIQQLQLSNNTLSDDRTVEIITQLIAKPSITILNIQECNLSAEQQAAIQKCWGYRGLSL